MQYQLCTECHPFGKIIFAPLNECAEGRGHALDEFLPVASALFARVIGIGAFCHRGSTFFPGLAVVGIEPDIDVDVEGVGGQMVLDVGTDVSAVFFYGVVFHPFSGLLFGDTPFFHADALPDCFHFVIVVPVCCPGYGAGAFDVAVSPGDSFLFLFPVGTDPVIVGCPFPEFCVGPGEGVFLSDRFDKGVFPGEPVFFFCGAAVDFVALDPFPVFGGALL